MHFRAEQPAHRERLVAHHLGGQPKTRTAGQQAVLRIALRTASRVTFELCRYAADVTSILRKRFMSHLAAPARSPASRAAPDATAARPASRTPPPFAPARVPKIASQSGSRARARSADSSRRPASAPARAGSTGTPGGSGWKTAGTPGLTSSPSAMKLPRCWRCVFRRLSCGSSRMIGDELIIISSSDCCQLRDPHPLLRQFGRNLAHVVIEQQLPLLRVAIGLRRSAGRQVLRAACAGFQPTRGSSVVPIRK